MSIYIDTCVLPRSRLETGKIYRERFGKGLGFELLMMFDLPDFEENLRQNLDLFAGGPLIFHEPVWGVEHSAPRGSAEWEAGMYHLRLTKKYAEILHPALMVCHLNNCPIRPGEEERMLKTALDNLEEMRDMFPDVPLLVENTGTRTDGTMLLNQAEFTDLCRDRKLPVLIDVGHANANGWDLRKLIGDLGPQTRGFHLHNNDGIHDLHNRLTDGTLDLRELVPWMDRMAPGVPRVIEYCRTELHGEPLLQDIQTLRELSASSPEEEKEDGKGDREAALSPDQIRYILRSMNEAVCLTGLNGKVLYANPAAEKLFGIRSTEGKRIWEAIPYREKNDALIQLFIDGVTEKNGSRRAMVDYMNNEGELFHLYVNLTSEAKGAGLILIVINDLTRLINAHSAFARYTSPEIANYVLTAPNGMEQGGAEREVTILMSDLRGFTGMCSSLASGDLITMLNHYFETMAEVIRSAKGTVIEFLGDGIFVVFGAPEDMPDHAAAAVGCAVDMQNAMEKVNAWNRERGYPELAMGIGIHSGTCVVGNIGSGDKMKYGCMGDTVNLAGRLETFSIGGQIHISEETRKRIRTEVRTGRKSSFMPKGGREEMTFCSVTGIGKKQLRSGEEDTGKWKPYPDAPEIRYRLLDGKTVGSRIYSGRMTGVSPDGRYGLLETGEELEPLWDLVFTDKGKDVYAKVMEREEKGYRIGFTFRTEEAGEGQEKS